jgi:hypothetical protein
MKMNPHGRRADSQHLRYLGDLIPSKTMQGDNVVLTALQLSNALASLVVTIRRKHNIGSITAVRRAWLPSGIVMRSRLSGPVRSTPDLQDLSRKRRRQPGLTLLVSQAADSRPVFQRFQVGPLEGIVRVSPVAMAHPVRFAEQSFRGFPVKHPELGSLVGTQQGLPPGTS